MDTESRLGGDVYARTPGYVIQEYGDRRCFGYGAEMPVYTLLRRCVVVGANRQDSREMCSENGCETVQFLHHACGAVSAHTQYQRQAPSHFAHDKVAHGGFLLVGQRGGFAGGTEYHNIIGVAGELDIQQAVECLIINGQVLLKGRNKCRTQTIQVALRTVVSFAKVSHCFVWFLYNVLFAGIQIPYRCYRSE